MSDKVSNPNLEWKKTTFGEQDKVTLKTNVAKAVEYNAKKDNIFQGSRPLATDLPAGLKKIRKKIKNALDDDDDEDEETIAISSHMPEDNSLLNALYDDEKKMLKPMETDNIMRQQLEVEKMSTLTLANNMAKQAGFSGLKQDTIHQGIADNSIGGRKLQNTLRKEFKTELKITKQWDNLSNKDLVNLMEGVNKIKAVGGKESLVVLGGMNVKEVVAAGKEEDNEMKIARTICEKTGRKECKSSAKKKEEAEIIMVKNQKVNKGFAKER